MNTKKPRYDIATEQAKKLLAFSPERPVRLLNILNALGLSTRYAKPEDGLTEEAMLLPQEKTILVKCDDAPVTRKLFSIAHEIGHFVLHSHDKERCRLNTQNLMNLDQNEMVEEQEANAFAAELLMSYDETKNMLLKGYEIQDIMAHFNVSYSFAVFRTSFIVKGF